MTKLLIDFRRPKRIEKKKIKNEKEKEKTPSLSVVISACVRTKCNLSIKKKNASPCLKGPGLMNRPRKSEKKSQDIILNVYIYIYIRAFGFCVWNHSLFYRIAARSMCRYIHTHIYMYIINTLWPHTQWFLDRNFRGC